MRPRILRCLLRQIQARVDQPTRNQDYPETPSMFQNRHSAQYKPVLPYVPVCTRQVGGGDQRNGIFARANAGGGPPAFFGGLEAAKGTP